MNVTKVISIDEAANIDPAAFNDFVLGGGLPPVTNLNQLAIRLSMGAPKIRSKQAVFMPKKMALHVASAWNLPRLPGLLVQFDKHSNKHTAAVAV